MNNNRLKQIIKEVNAETPPTLEKIDPVLRDYIRNLAIQNKVLTLDIKILKTNLNTLLTWHHYELKKTRVDPDGKRHYIERLMYLSKTDVEIMKMPRVL